MRGLGSINSIGISEAQKGDRNVVLAAVAKMGLRYRVCISST